MPPQLRLDRIRRISGRMLLDHTHDLVSVPAQWQGETFAWESVLDLREHVQRLRDFLQRPEQLVLLNLMGRLAADPTVATPAAFQGRIITFDHTSIVAPFGVT